MDRKETTYTDSEAVDQGVSGEALWLVFPEHTSLCPSPPPNPSSSFWGIPSSSGQLKMRPSTAGTKLKKTTIMLGNVEVILPEISPEKWVSILAAAKKGEQCFKKKGIVY